jgi:MFS family permease
MLGGKSMTKKEINQQPRGDASLWAVGWMSFFWSVGTVMVAGVLPTFLTEVLQMSHSHVGILEGLAIFSMFGAKVISGVLSDRIRNRKPMIALGSTLTILVKFLFAMSHGFYMIFLAKCLDRLSRGIRAAPTEALVADLSTASTHGRSYGIRQTLYPLGVVFGSLLTTWLMMVTQNSYRTVFWLSAIPGALALGILIWGVKQPPIPQDLPGPTSSWDLGQIRHLPLSFWMTVGVTSILMLARFSETFLNLRAKSLGWDISKLPLIFVAYDLVHALVAYPIGAMADRMDRRKLFLLGLLVLIGANWVLIQAQTPPGVLMGVILVGLHMGMTQGLIGAMIAQSSPQSLRGTAFAIYYFFAGIFAMVGNVIAGYLSDLWGIQGCFYGGGFFTIIAVIALLGLILSESPSKKEGS